MFGQRKAITRSYVQLVDSTGRLAKEDIALLSGPISEIGEVASDGAWVLQHRDRSMPSAAAVASMTRVETKKSFTDRTAERSSQCCASDPFNPHDPSVTIRLLIPTPAQRVSRS